jgi:hypothetical protein
LLIVLLVPLAFAGCSTHADRLREVRESYYGGNPNLAAALLEKQLEQPRGEADVLKLDRAMIQLSLGEPRQAEQTLREVRDSFDYLEQKSLGESALTMVTDDQAASYSGEDYEKVLIRAFLALANLMHDGSDAEAYALQVSEKQEQVIQSGKVEGEQNPKLAYKRVALGAYLRGVLCEASHANYDDVARNWATVVSWEPEFAAGRQDLDRATHGHHSNPGNGVLYVFALVGRGPYKEETEEIPSQIAMLIADRIISATSKHTLPPTLAPIKVPKVVASYNKVQSVEVTVNGQFGGRTETLTDVGRLAVEQYEAVYPYVVARAVARRALKKGIVYGTKEAMHVDNPWIELAMDAGGVVWEATESADTRCWGLLPDRIQVLRVEMPAGEQRIGLRPANGTLLMGAEQTQTVTIADGRNTYLMAAFPGSRLVGQILVRQN